MNNQPVIVHLLAPILRRDGHPLVQAHRRIVTSPDFTLGNQSGPLDCARGVADWRADLTAYDALPEELRQMMQAAPFELDAEGVLFDFERLTRRCGSRAMAIAQIAAEISKFIAETSAAATMERDPTHAETPKGLGRP